MTDYKALCKKLTDAYEHELNKRGMGCELINHARAALAQPKPVGPTDEGEWYPGFADWLEREMPEGTVIGDPLWWASKIADYLARWGHPTVKPVPQQEPPK